VIYLLEAFLWGEIMDYETVTVGLIPSLGVLNVEVKFPCHLSVVAVFDDVVYGFEVFRDERTKKVGVRLRSIIRGYEKIEFEYVKYGDEEVPNVFVEDGTGSTYEFPRAVVVVHGKLVRTEGTDFVRWFAPRMSN